MSSMVLTHTAELTMPQFQEANLCGDSDTFSKDETLDSADSAEEDVLDEEEGHDEHQLRMIINGKSLYVFGDISDNHMDKAYEPERAAVALDVKLMPHC